MNNLVHDPYPAARLPEELREGFDADEDVRVVVESRRKRRGYTLSELLEIKKTITPATDDPVERIRKLRDEWD